MVKEIRIFHYFPMCCWTNGCVRFDPEHTWSTMMEIVMLVFLMKVGSV